MESLTPFIRRQFEDAPGPSSPPEAAGSRVSLWDISERSAWVIFWPKTTSRLSCALDKTPSSARLAK